MALQTARQASLNLPNNWKTPEYFCSDHTRPEDIAKEFAFCCASREYFIQRYCKIYDKQLRRWTPFTLWPEQALALYGLESSDYVVVLKARQLGLTWLVVAYDLYDFIFNPIHKPLLFSKGDAEVITIIDERYQGMYERLPRWLQAESVDIDNKHDLAISTGSHVRGRSTKGGRSYEGTRVIVDEADYVRNLPELMRSVQPIIDDGGQIILLSTSDKDAPLSEFKRIFRMAAAGKSRWKSIFLSWRANPARTDEWYEETRNDIMLRTGSDDSMKSEFPNDAAEALAPAEFNKKLPVNFIQKIYTEKDPIGQAVLATVQGLVVYRKPQDGVQYYIGADTAEGLPHGDLSAMAVVDEVGRQCAVYNETSEPHIFGSDISKVSEYYNEAWANVERNNHGHAVIGWLKDHSTVWIVPYFVDGRAGWLDNSKGKALLYDGLVEMVGENKCDIVDPETFNQVASIERTTLRAPDKMHDDVADAYALAVACLKYQPPVPQIRRL
jgi:hypothetical protein